jgi:hypothetical protein
MSSDNIAYEKFNLIEVKSESEDGEKDYYIEGHISTIDPDSARDITTSSCQDDLTLQTKTRDITMDLDHESFRNEDGTTPERDLNKIPVAKITESKRTAVGTYVKAMLNKSHPMFKNILSSIKNGFLHSFSIAYHVKDAVSKNVNGEMFRLLNKVELRNVGITGNPVNTNATFSVSLKSYIKKMEETQEYSKLEEAIVNLKSELSSELKLSFDSLKEDLNKSISELKSVKPDEEEEQEASEEESLEVKSLKERLVELENKLKEPVMSGAVEAEIKSQATEEKTSLDFGAYIY